MNEITIEYKYLKMEEKQFATFEENLASDEIEIANEVNFGFNFASNVLVCTETIGYNQAGKPLMKLCIASYFHINPESVKQIAVENGIRLPKAILCQLASLNYGAMRGIIFEKTKGMALNRFILPPFYFDTLIKDENVIIKKVQG